MKQTFEEKKEQIKNFRPIDDVFFEVLAKNIRVCEEMLRVFMEDPKLTVQEVHTQNSIKNLYGRSVRLDALCTLGDGRSANIEVQRSNNDNHLRRVRYNASCVTANITDPGEKFEKVPDVYVIYLSEFDVFRKEKTSYHIDKVIRETGDKVDDGLYELFINAKIDDGTEIAELMQCFLQKEVDNPKFPELSERVRFIKNTEEGVSDMCEVMEKYSEQRYQDGMAKGMAKGMDEKTKVAALEMHKDGFSFEQIAKYLKEPVSKIKTLCL